MKNKWVLRIDDRLSTASPYGINLGLQESESDKSIHLIGPCETLDDFQKEIAHLILELNELSQQAKQKLESFARQPGAQPAVDAAQIWKELEACGTDHEMFALFNSYEPVQRQEVAEYVFTHVNMFKGRGPVFSEHYDAASHLLD
ncbi:hypothetical protein [Desulfoferrobacter suflitae]|uniref:hypothetical protein n=1 Tax=Desulfoferrobacter suflitae TaxID=2865782 RepID=UPI0021646825|nr:hypothetical protein [Desulfoferrobacter suflitae]MCK8601262.1 hypothetical protein [Desulfoferrobacter suflitae]